MPPFTDILREIRKGAAVTRATLLLAQVVAAVDETNKAGSVTITLTVKPDKIAGGRQKTIAVTVSAKTPQADLLAAIFFSTDDGDLVRTDPDQAELFGDADETRPRSRQVAERGAFCAHAATLALPYSEEWKTWSSWSGNLKDQLSFARFLEENAVDVIAPIGADLLEVCRDLQVRRKVNFIKAVRTATDHENFEWTDETEATSRSSSGAIEVPTKFQLSLPVYFGDAPTSVFAFLRWVLNDGVLNLGYVLHRAEHVRQAVFKQIVLDVGHRTSCPIVFGKP